MRKLSHKELKVSDLPQLLSVRWRLEPRHFIPWTPPWTADRALTAALPSFQRLGLHTSRTYTEGKKVWSPEASGTGPFHLSGFGPKRCWGLKKAGWSQSGAGRGWGAGPALRPGPRRQIRTCTGAPDGGAALHQLATMRQPGSQELYLFYNLTQSPSLLSMLHYSYFETEKVEVQMS